MIGGAIEAGSETGTFGRLGLFVRDAGGSLLALTSRELLQGGESVYLVENDKRRCIGSRRNPFHPFADDAGSAPGLAAWFCPDVEVPENLVEWSASPVLDVDELIGRRVTAVCGDGDGPKGTVVRTRWFADVSAAPGGPPRPYEGLIRIFVAEGSQGDASGLSGALVRTLDDELVGIVVGRCGADLVVVPLVSILKSESLHVATLADIQSHNRSVGCVGSTTHFRRRENGLISLISAQLGVSGDEINLPEVVLLQWINLGWIASTTNHRLEAFEPFGKYFSNLHDNLNNLQSSILNFAVAELPTYPDHEIAADALSIAMLEFFGSHSDWEKSVQRSQSSTRRPPGSHDHVRT